LHRYKIHYKSPGTVTDKMNVPFERTLNALSTSCIICINSPQWNPEAFMHSTVSAWHENDSKRRYWLIQKFINNYWK